VNNTNVFQGKMVQSHHISRAGGPDKKMKKKKKKKLNLPDLDHSF
jgi:hypothetical protein